MFTRSPKQSHMDELWLLASFTQYFLHQIQPCCCMYCSVFPLFVVEYLLTYSAQEDMAGRVVIFGYYGKYHPEHSFLGHTHTSLWGIYPGLAFPGQLYEITAQRCFTLLNTFTPQQWEGETQLFHVPMDTGITCLIPYSRPGGAEGVTTITFVTSPATSVLPTDVLR